MPESFVQITEGGGKKLRTFERTVGANNVHEEGVVLGEPYLASYTIVTSTAPSTATSASHLLQIMAGASLKVRIRRIEIYQAVMATAATVQDFSIFRLTTAGTGGTSITPVVMDPADSAASVSPMTLPTVKGTEGTRPALRYAYLMQTIAASAELTNPIAVFDFDLPRSKPLIIPAGTSNGIAVKNGAAVAGAQVSFMVWFDESNF